MHLLDKPLPLLVFRKSIPNSATLSCPIVAFNTVGWVMHSLREAYQIEPQKVLYRGAGSKATETNRTSRLPNRGIFRTSNYGHVMVTTFWTYGAKFQCYDLVGLLVVCYRRKAVVLQNLNKFIE